MKTFIKPNPPRHIYLPSPWGEGKGGAYMLKKTLFAAFISLIAIAGYAQSPVIKCDISFQGRSDAEVLEPGYTRWDPGKDITSTETTIDGVYFKIESSGEHLFRNDWNKSDITNADFKAKNGRLLADCIMLDPSSYEGAFIMTIKGLPAGQHTLQTYHNCKDNPETVDVRPMNVLLNGKTVIENLVPSIRESVAANAGISVVTFTVSSPDDAVKIMFNTIPTKDPVTTKTIVRSPIINGFELNTVSITSQAKDPFPTSGDMHVDADGGSCQLSWAAASANISSHNLYIGTSATDVENATTPTASGLTATTYLASNLSTHNTYYWRVDEVDAQGNITKGNVWKFRPRRLAFPGAEGYGRFAIGGRGGQVYHVTNLNFDHNPGSLLYGLKDLEGPRTIVFDVSGVIDMNFEAVFTDPNVTIAAHTAPGKGICVMHANLNIGSDDICRFLRLKHGYGYANGEPNTGNAMGMTGADHAIVDHTTAAWGTDETLSGRGAKNITFQYSMIAEALGVADHKNYSKGTNHGYAATIDGKIGTYSHNLLVNCYGRNWSMGGGMDGTNTAIGQMDMFNNVCYNWGSRTTDGGCHEANFVNNYYKMGPASSQKILYSQDYENVGSPQSTWQAYISGNIRENKDHSLTYDKQGDTYRYTLSNGASAPSYEVFVKAPFFPSYAEIHSAKDAFKIVTSNSGATMPCRDDQHLRVTRETIEGTYTYTGSRSGIKGEIDHENDCGGWESYPEESRPADYDTDQDGMPNWYEAIIGSDANVANHNADPDNDGYTLLEEYLEFIAHPYIIIMEGETGTFDVSAEFKGFTKSPSYSVASADAFLTSTISGSTLSVKPTTAGIGKTIVKVTDAEGSSYTQQFGVAVTRDPSAIQNIFNEANLDIIRREFFTLDGKAVTSLGDLHSGILLMKITERNGKTHTMKIVKN